MRTQSARRYEQRRRARFLRDQLDAAAGRDHGQRRRRDEPSHRTPACEVLLTGVLARPITAARRFGIRSSDC